jgi:superfamily II DNA or RNA helicase
MQGLVTQDVPIHTAAMSAFPYSPDLEARYTFKTAFDDIVCMAVKRGNTLLVPRETAPISKNDFRVRKTPAAIDCKIQWRHEQESLCRKSLQLLLEGRNHIFDAPTGHGKTIEGSWVAAKVGQPTMIIVPKDDLVVQWKKSLINVLGISPSLVGHVQQNICDWKGKQFVVGMVHSLVIPDRYPEEMYRHFGMVIFDEVHMMATDHFIRACQLFPAYYRLGFSATVNRRDGKSKMLEAHIGPVLVRGTVVAMKPTVIVRATGWKIPTRPEFVEGQKVFKKIPHSPGRMMLVTKAMAASPVRNLEVVTFSSQAYKSGRRVLIMSELIEDHLEKLFHLLTEAGVPGQDIGYYCGGRSKAEHARAKKSRVVLATYQMCSTGTDVPEWDTLVMATPRANVKQPVGRVLRYADGKRRPVIFDPVDDDAIFRSFHQSRLKQYYELGAEILKF